MRIRLDIPLRLYKIAEAVDATASKGDAVIEYICTDSRVCLKNDLFVALKGENFDGNDFLAEAQSKGAIILGSNPELCDLFVPMDSQPLLKIAELYKKQLGSLRKTICITGSVGKSTTKEMLKKMLSQICNVHATEGNFNNEVGVPLTLLSAPKETEILLIEMGMNHSGEIKRLSECARPDIGIITNIGTAHVGLLGSRENIALAKLEILCGMTEDGILIGPDGEELLASSLNKRAGVNAIDADVNLSLVQADTYSSKISLYISKKLAFTADVSIGGLHNLKNLSLAITALLAIGIEAGTIRSLITSLSDDISRQSTLFYKNITLIDDSYNASYESVCAALDYICVHKESPKSLLFSDILELGDMSEKIHEDVGYAIAVHKLDKLYVFGKYGYATKRGAIRGGMNSSDIFLFDEASAEKTIAEQIYRNLDSGEIIIAKASHRTKMGGVISALKERLEKDA